MLEDYLEIPDKEEIRERLKDASLNEQALMFMRWEDREAMNQVMEGIGDMYMTPDSTGFPWETTSLEFFKWLNTFNSCIFVAEEIFRNAVDNDNLPIVKYMLETQNDLKTRITNANLLHYVVSMETFHYLIRYVRPEIRQAAIKALLLHRLEHELVYQMATPPNLEKLHNIRSFVSTLSADSAIRLLSEHLKSR